MNTTDYLRGYAAGFRAGAQVFAPGLVRGMRVRDTLAHWLWLIRARKAVRRRLGALATQTPKTAPRGCGAV